MNVLHPRCAGLDVHKKTVAVCLLTPGEGGEPRRRIREFGTATFELRALAVWLRKHRITHAAMESTGVYWKPIFNLLEPGLEIILVNARHVRNVPGRKSDIADCQWLASLLRHGLLEASFVPPRAVRELRDLCRMRTSLVRDAVRAGNRLRKVLEDANVKLDSVASNALGVSGRSMIAALIAGEDDPVALAELARGRLREKTPQLIAALDGRVSEHHRFLLAEWMWGFERLEEQIARLEQRIDEHMRPFEWAAALLETMPGVRRIAACALIAEIGVEMQRFPSSRHLASWAGLCPGANESAGKRKGGKSHRGNRWIKGLMTEVAWAGARTKDTYVSQHYRRLAPRCGAKRALVAVANTQIQAAWHILANRTPYRDLGPDYFDRRNQDRLTRHLVRRLEKLGHQVALSPAS